MYKVIRAFDDRFDDYYHYDPNDKKRNSYPRKGFKPNENRFDALLKAEISELNLSGQSFIEKVERKPKEEE